MLREGGGGVDAPDWADDVALVAHAFPGEAAPFGGSAWDVPLPWFNHLRGRAEALAPPAMEELAALFGRGRR